MTDWNGYYVVYDGNCNLCTNLVRLLENWDRGVRFRYAPMQNEALLAGLGISPEDCELGMLLINSQKTEERWQGSAAAEKIGRLLPLGEGFVQAYRAIPGLKGEGDRVYEYVRDHRYALFGRRDRTYRPAYPLCTPEVCSPEAVKSQGTETG